MEKPEVLSGDLDLSMGKPSLLSVSVRDMPPDDEMGHA